MDLIVATPGLDSQRFRVPVTPLSPRPFSRYPLIYAAFSKEAEIVSVAFVFERSLLAFAERRARGGKGAAVGLRVRLPPAPAMSPPWRECSARAD